ncbi:MAG: hypothetical protein AAF630_06925 [Cyanobacteria bacterium P01_C01_bin.38]
MSEDTGPTILLAILLIGFAYFGIGNFIKISGQESTKLSVTFRPKFSFFLAILVSAFFFGLVYGTFTFNPIKKVVCEHSSQNVSFVSTDIDNQNKSTPIDCKFTEFYWFNSERKSKLISNILEAKLEKILTEKIIIKDEDYSEYKYRILFITQTEDIPITDYTFVKYRGEKLQLVTSSINDFFSNSEEKRFLGIIDDRNTAYTGFAGILFLLIIILLLTLTGLFINFTFDKETNLVTVSSYRCFGIFGKKVSEYSFDEIIDIKYNRIDLGDSGYGSQVFLVVPDDEIKLNPIGMISKYIDGDYVVMIIKKFLGRWKKM